MGKRLEKIARAAHIKQDTVGTSNEISFSVLDAKKNAAEDEKAVGGSSGLGGISLFTLGKKKPIATPSRKEELVLSSPSADKDKKNSSKGASKDPWQPPAGEVASRKASRKARKGLATGAIAVLAVVLVAFVGSMLFKQFEGHQEERRGLAGHIEDVEKMSASLVDFDKFVGSLIGVSPENINADEAEETYEQVSKNLVSTKNNLTNERMSIESVQARLEDARSQEVANQAIVFINARADAISYGEDFAEEAIGFARAYERAVKGWEQVLEADALARDAASLATSTSVENVELSMEKSNQAIDLFVKSRVNFAGAEDECGIDFSDFIDYLNLRIDAQKQALVSDQAYLDRDKTTMTSANDAYNELDSQAVNLIKQQEVMPMEMIMAFYAEKVPELSSSYEAQLSIAANAEVILQEYLGTVSK